MYAWFCVPWFCVGNCVSGCTCVRSTRLLCSQPFATVCNRLQPFATVRNPLQPSAIRKLREEGYGRDSHFWRFLRKRFLRQHLQRFRFWLQFFWCITWPCVTLALQNMPPKARAPEARMAFQYGQVSGVKFCTCSGPSRCLPRVWKKWVKECFHIFLHLDLPTLYSAT